MSNEEAVKQGLDVILKEINDYKSSAETDDQYYMKLLETRRLLASRPKDLSGLELLKYMITLFPDRKYAQAVMALLSTTNENDAYAILEETIWKHERLIILNEGETIAPKQGMKVSDIVKKDAPRKTLYRVKVQHLITQHIVNHWGEMTFLHADAELTPSKVEYADISVLEVSGYLDKYLFNGMIKIELGDDESAVYPITNQVARIKDGDRVVLNGLTISDPI